jgi:multimeric flavodoxin WrbA
MKVLALIGSPRKVSNTDLLVTAILDGAKTNGNSTEKIYLYDVEIKPCVDCRACKKDAYQCALKDGMQTLYPKLQEADVIVFGTPLYWYGVSAKMKLLIDRLRPCVASRGLCGKKAVLVIPSEEGAGACNFAVGMFTQSFSYIGVDLAGKLLSKASQKAEILNHPQTLKEAFMLGKALK